MLHIPPTNLLLLAAKQEPYKKSYLITKNTQEFSGKKVRRMGQQVEKDLAERVAGLGWRTREEIVKYNQMTALRFQAGGRHQTSPASLWGSWWSMHHHKKKIAGKWQERTLHISLCLLYPSLSPLSLSLSSFFLFFFFWQIRSQAIIACLLKRVQHPC